MKGLVRLAKGDEPHAGSMVCSKCGDLPSKHVNVNSYASNDVVSSCTVAGCSCRFVVGVQSA